MKQIGLSQSELERIILRPMHFKLGLTTVTMGRPEETLEALIKANKYFAEAVESALRQVATAIAKNNERIAEQLEEAGFKIT